MESDYYNLLNIINDNLYKILSNELKLLKVKNKEIEELKNIYSIAETNYIKFMNHLKRNNKLIYETIPHGMEDLNIW